MTYYEKCEFITSVKSFVEVIRQLCRNLVKEMNCYLYSIQIFYNSYYLKLSKIQVFNGESDNCCT